MTNKKDSTYRQVGVILAGGVGRRFGAAMPKQFAMAANRTILEHTVAAFEQCKCIDEIVVVIHPDYRDLVEALLSRNQFTKVKKLLSGGKERYLSSLAAIEAYAGEDVNLLFHDAARPLIHQTTLEAVVEALKTHQAVGVGVPVTDTIFEVSPATMELRAVPDRNRMYKAQTPQAFRREVIAKAYELAMWDKDFHATDDCGVVRTYLPEVPIYIVKGNRQNIKITHKEDLQIADRLLRRRARW